MKRIRVWATFYLLVTGLVLGGVGVRAWVAPSITMDQTLAAARLPETEPRETTFWEAIHSSAWWDGIREFSGGVNVLVGTLLIGGAYRKTQPCLRISALYTGSLVIVLLSQTVLTQLPDVRTLCEIMATMMASALAILLLAGMSACTRPEPFDQIKY